MQLAQQRPCFHRAGHMAAIVIDKLPEGERQAIVHMRTWRKLSAWRDHGEILRREKAGEIEIECQPLLYRLTNQPSGRGHPRYHRCGLQMHQHIAAVGKYLGRIRVTQAQLLRNRNGSSDGLRTQRIHLPIVPANME
jgi:hypothetical protein